ncbi:MAG: hypothetical protein RIQ33_2084 [Bacteroidota bacterium]
MNKIIFLALFSLLFFNKKIIAQKSYADLGSWNSFSVEGKINKKFSILFNEDMRIRENISQLNLFYTEIGLQYKPVSFIKTSIAYRWIDKYVYEDESFSFRNRLMWDFTIKKNINKKISLSYRHRLQAEKKDMFTSEKGYLTEWYSRNKVAAKYQLTKKLNANLSVEFRYQIHDQRNLESEKTWHRNRYQTGVDYAINNKNEIGIYYLIQREYNVSVPENFYVIGFQYSLTLDFSKSFKPITKSANE